MRQNIDYQALLDKFYDVPINARAMAKQKATNETFLSRELGAALGCRCETPAGYGLGRIDCLSQAILIECKKGGTHQEKQAIGQAITYAYSLRFKGDIALGIIGTEGNVKPGTALFCRDFGIYIFYYNTYTRRWKLIYEPKDGQKYGQVV